MMFIPILQLLALVRDKRGRPELPVFVLNLVAEEAEAGRMKTTGCPCNEAGEPANEQRPIPPGDWAKMSFPLAAPGGYGQTFWDGSGGRRAYSDVLVDVEALFAANVLVPFNQGSNVTPPEIKQRLATDEEIVTVIEEVKTEYGGRIPAVRKHLAPKVSKHLNTRHLLTSAARVEAVYKNKYPTRSTGRPKI
jgi:hypothetical protein